MEELVAFLIGLASQYPVLATIFMVIGGLRVVMKPIMSVLQAYVDYTPDPADNAKLAAVMESSIYKGIAYVLDLFASVKLPAAK